MIDRQDGINGQWTCGVDIETLEEKDKVCVSEDLGKEPIYLKVTGGRRRPIDQTPEDTAVREVFEETGIRISKSELQYVASYNRKNHMYHLFSVKIDKKRLEGRYTVGKNGEKVHVLTREELRQKRDEFLPHHLVMLEKHGLWPK